MIRTRFAPSPTGDLHIGGARTALFNFLLAEKAGAEGSFILRIDDTDAERSRPEYEVRLMEDLRWLGLSWDEGPDMGLAVPYRQSQRLGLYAEVLQRLRDVGVAYPCFCSEERLELLRGEQLAKGEPPRYDGLCRRIPPEEAGSRIHCGEKPCWRFALPRTSVAFHDEIRGALSFASETMGDFVLARSSGQPTYLFTSVVDDHLLGITHIVRGDEHVPNTARQQAIFDALGWPAPVYAHVPMILSEDRQKLSKRTGSTPVRQYREKGYFADALVAYLSTLSWTPPESAPLTELFSSPEFMEKMAAVFSLERISASSPVHDESHLHYWQKMAMRKRGSEALLQLLESSDSRFQAFEPAALKLLIQDLSEESCTVPLLREALVFLFERPAARDEDWLPELKQELGKVEPWNEEELNRILRTFMKTRGMKGKDFFHPLRLALTGRESGAALTLIMQVLGREESLFRL